MTVHEYITGPILPTITEIPSTGMKIEGSEGSSTRSNADIK